MADEERPSGIAIINAIRVQRQSNDVSDRSNLSDTLVKGKKWKESTLQKIENKAGVQSLTLQDYVAEIERLRQTIARLESENVRLIEQRRNILAAQKIELLELQQAYDQFQQESDLLLTELDHENERLRTGIHRIN